MYESESTSSSLTRCTCSAFRRPFCPLPITGYLGTLDFASIGASECCANGADEAVLLLFGISGTKVSSSERSEDGIKVRGLTSSSQISSTDRRVVICNILKSFAHRDYAYSGGKT